MRAEPTHADPAAGPHASDAPLFAEVAGLAFTALIDGVVPAGPGRRDRARFGLGGGVPAAPRCSTTGVAAVALPADPRKRRPADRAVARSRGLRHVAPRRDLRHRRPPGWRCAPPPMPEIPSGDDMATTSASCSCPVCGTPFARVRRQRYCSDTCRRTAWRRRHAAAGATSRLTTAIGCAQCGQRATAFGTPLLAGTAFWTPFLAPSATGRGAAGRRPSARSWRWCQSATRHRRDNTVYECGECQTRYLGEQWCVECVRPCRRVGVGGLCPHCDEPVAIPDLLEAAETPAELEVITMPDR